MASTAFATRVTTLRLLSSTHPELLLFDALLAGSTHHCLLRLSLAAYFKGMDAPHPARELS